MPLPPSSPANRDELTELSIAKRTKSSSLGTRSAGRVIGSCTVLLCDWHDDVVTFNGLSCRGPAPDGKAGEVDINDLIVFDEFFRKPVRYDPVLQCPFVIGPTHRRTMHAPPSSAGPRMKPRRAFRSVRMRSIGPLLSQCRLVSSFSLFLPDGGLLNKIGDGREYAVSYFAPSPWRHKGLGGMLQGRHEVKPADTQNASQSRFV